MNLLSTNPHLAKQEAEFEAQKQYQESEWRLSFLRTTTAEQQQAITEEELFIWYQQHNNLCKPRLS